LIRIQSQKLGPVQRRAADGLSPGAGD
jgi:hypothetical protein